MGAMPRVARQSVAEADRSGELGGFGRYAGPATLILSSLAEGPKHGYALTKDVPREFWETWLEQNVDLDCVHAACWLRLVRSDCLDRDYKRHAHLATARPR